MSYIARTEWTRRGSGEEVVAEWLDGRCPHGSYVRLIVDGDEKDEERFITGLEARNYVARLKREEETSHG